MKSKTVKYILLGLIVLVIIEAVVGYMIVRNNRRKAEMLNEREKTSHSTDDMKVKERAENDSAQTENDIEEPVLYAESACIFRVDSPESGTFIYGKNEDEKRAQASTTKLMTAILLIESGKLEDSTVISENAASTKESYRKLEAGDVYNNHDLLYALMLPSANDAAVAIAESVAGDVESFVSMMNDKVAELGLNDTMFLNPHGLDQEGHYSTAKDVALLTSYAYEYPEIREAWTCATKPITSLKNGDTWVLQSTTKILGYDDNFKGGKTGTQNIAGYCFTGVYEKDDVEYVTVVLGCNDEEERWADTKALHNYIKQLR